MSDTTIQTARSTEPDSTSHESAPRPMDTNLADFNTDVLLGWVLGVLTPFLMAGGITDITIARRAAQEAIEATIADGRNGLLTPAQIIAFVLAALDNLRLSMNEDVSLPIKLRLRANASSLIRATVRPPKRRGKPVHQPPFLPNLSSPNLLPPEPVTPERTEQQNRMHWADAMKTAAANLQAENADVSPAQRKTDQLWIELLNDVANELRTPAQPHTGMSKTELLLTTLMAGESESPDCHAD